MRARLTSAAVAAIACAVTLALTTTAFAATISGTVRDSYRLATVSGVAVSILSADDPASQLTSATTDANGAFRFSGLADGSYYLYFADAADRYWPAWYEEESEFWEADPVTVSGSAETTLDMQLDPEHVKYVSHLDTPTAEPDATTTLYVGEQATIDTTCTDALWGGGLFGMHVTLQSSKDQVTWSDVSSALDPDWDGTYSAPVVPGRSGTWYYRFAIKDAIDSEATESAVACLTAVLRPTHWEGATFKGTSVSDLSVPAAWQTLVIAARLTDESGQPISFASARVQCSVDGVTWANSGYPASPDLNGLYYASVMSGQWTFYRFAYFASDGEFSSASQPVVMRSPWATHWGSPPGKSRPHKQVVFAGMVFPPVGSPSKLVWVEIQRAGVNRWDKEWAGWARGSTEYDAVHWSVVRTLTTKGKYRFRATVKRRDAYHFPVTSHWFTTVVK